MGSAGTILIIDDDPGVREALAAALAGRYTIHVVADAAAALDALAAYCFDLILLDYRLPDLPGTVVLQAIKRFFPSTLVILMTGFGSEDVAVQAFRGGVRDYIRKPVDCQDLQARIHALLAIRRSEATRRRNLYPEPDDQSASFAIPDLQGGDHAQAILRAIRHIDQHLDAALSLAAVARAAGMSKFHFCRRFRASTGVYFREYLARRRIAKAKELLQDTGRTVTDIFREVGFKDMTHFGRVFKRLEGALPSEFRRGGGGHKPPRPSSLGQENSSAPEV